MTDGLRVLTLNLLAPQKGDYERRRPVLADRLRRLRPDVAAFQEARWGEGTDQAVELLEPGYQVAWHSGRSADGVGAVLASRWPLGTIRELDLHVTGRTADFPWCAALVAEIMAPPPLGPLLFVHHKPNWQYGYERECELQAVATARFVEDLVAGQDRNVVLAGEGQAHRPGRHRIQHDHREPCPQPMFMTKTMNARVRSSRWPTRNRMPSAISDRSRRCPWTAGRNAPRSTAKPAAATA